MVNVAIAGYRLGNTDEASTHCGHFTTYFNNLFSGGSQGSIYVSI